YADMPVENVKSVEITTYRVSEDGSIIEDVTMRKLGSNEAYVKVTRSGVLGTLDSEELQLTQRSSGHRAIQFAAAMGCEVVVFSSTESKRTEAIELGSKEFHFTNDVMEFEGIKKIKHLLIGRSAQPYYKLCVADVLTFSPFPCLLENPCIL
ncbi:hypothetical protein LTR39_000966, partial [Cryomyces antarcticus]